MIVASSHFERNGRCFANYDQDRVRVRATPGPCRGYTSGLPRCAGTRGRARLSSPRVWGHSAIAAWGGPQSPDGAALRPESRPAVGVAYESRTFQTVEEPLLALP